jgi:thioredoxin 1
MENVINGTQDNLDAIIAQGKTTIVDFWAPWCGPCKTLGPILDKLAEERPDINVVKVNVDENSDLSSKYGIRSIPAVYIFKNGEQSQQFVGLKGKEEILGML